MDSNALKGKTPKIETPCGNLYVTINHDGAGFIREVFFTMGHQGYCHAALFESIGQLLGVMLGHDICLEDICKQLIGQKCGNPFWFDGKQYLSCPDAIGQLLQEEIKFRDVEAMI